MTTEWDGWVGREEQRFDRIDETLLTRWLATFDREAPSDTAVPQGFHWCLFTPEARTGGLGVDGHPVRNDAPDSFLPPIPLPRRMWASSRIEFIEPLHAGEQLTQRSRISSIAAKQGSSGYLVFVDIERETIGPAGVAVREVQSLVFRNAAPAGSPPTPAPLGPGSFDPAGWDFYCSVEPSETLLFRFSALTFNSHRIHYDHPYATRDEGYRGLVVHGPLTATLLLDAARQRFGDNALRRFDFRGIAPAICGERLHLVVRGGGTEVELGAFAGDGRTIMSAHAALT